MPDDLKDSWKKTGVGLGHAFRDLGKTIVKTVADVAKTADAHVNGTASDSDASHTDTKPEA